MPKTMPGADSIHATFLAGPAPWSEPLRDRESRYQIDAVSTVRGEAGPRPEPGWTMVRWESDAPRPAQGAVVYQGSTGPLQYTSAAQVAALARSRQEFRNGGGTVRAVLIPIRKSAAWWALPAEERRSHFARQPAREGHTQIGEPYVDRVFRRLYHAGGQGTGRTYDFLTYFEFRQSDEAIFRDLLAKLRDPERNPEWAYVDREWEIWMRLTDREVR